MDPGNERRRQADGAVDQLREELGAVKETMAVLGSTLATVDQVEARVREAEEKELAGRRQFALAIGVAVLIVAILGSISIVQVAQTNRTVNLIESCTIVGGDCYARLAQQGQLGVTRNAQYLKCVLLVQPAERTAAKIDDCYHEAYGDILVRGVTGGPERK